MNTKVSEIFYSHLKEHDLKEEDILAAIEEVALLYDKETGMYPEHQYEGRAFLNFCRGKSNPWQNEYDDWEKRIGSTKVAFIP